MTRGNPQPSLFKECHSNQQQNPSCSSISQKYIYILVNDFFFRVYVVISTVHYFPSFIYTISDRILILFSISFLILMVI